MGTECAEGYLRVSGLTGPGKRQKGKPASLWFVKSNIEIKTYMASFGRNNLLNTQEEVHKHVKANSVIFVLFQHCMFSMEMSVPDKGQAEMIHIAFQKAWALPFAMSNFGNAKSSGEVKISRKLTEPSDPTHSSLVEILSVQLQLNGGGGIFVGKKWEKQKSFSVQLGVEAGSI